MVKIINEEVNKRRDKILAVLRTKQWATAGYVQHCTGTSDKAVKRDLKYWEGKGCVEITLALDNTEKKFKDGSSAPTTNRITLARLTERGKKDQLAKTCGGTPKQIGTACKKNRSCICQD
jgi:DeoR/GlpR family transcriptional regulator of sugar metabolism